MLDRSWFASAGGLSCPRFFLRNSDGSYRSVFGPFLYADERADPEADASTLTATGGWTPDVGGYRVAEAASLIPVESRREGSSVPRNLGSTVSYLTARRSRDLITAAHQQITSDWWERRREDFDLFSSEVVVAEARLGDPASHPSAITWISLFPTSARQKSY